ncbi:MAG: pyridoxamine 5'-phosphate oxidase family protein [Synergistaceae bacterium]|nr:pyridoxamine 5'-phosphate oxidase family protein [Synergistaceae bacterium]
MKQVVSLLREAGVFHVATVENRQPRVRPFGFVMEYDGRIYFGTGNKKDVYRQLQKNPKAEISAMLKNDRWLRVSGEAVFDESIDVKRSAFEAQPELKNIYQSPDNPTFEVFYLKEPKAIIYSHVEEPKEIL